MSIGKKDAKRLSGVLSSGLSIGEERRKAVVLSFYRRGRKMQSGCVEWSFHYWV